MTSCGWATCWATSSKAGSNGSRTAALTERLRIGIQMHRAIDAFSDRHPAVRRSKSILTPEYGRLSGVIVDVFYDHVLARRWPEHHPRPLSVFTQDVYRTLRGNLHRMPAAVHPLIDAMSEAIGCEGMPASAASSARFGAWRRGVRWLRRSARRAACCPITSIASPPTLTSSCRTCVRAVPSSWPSATSDRTRARRYSFFSPARCAAQRFFWASEIAFRAFADIVRFFFGPPFGRPGPRLPEPPNARGNGTSDTR